MERTRPNRTSDDIQVNVWMPRTLKADLKRVAAQQDRSVAQILRGLARDYVTEFDAQVAS